MNYASLPRRRGLTALLLVLLPLALAACDSGTEPPEPQAIQVVAGDAQNAVVGNVVPVPPTVRVVTSKGKPVAGVDVQFAVSSGAGTVLGGSQTTDADGQASPSSWLLGTAPGENTLTVTSSKISGSSATIRATAVAGEPYGLAVVTQPAATATNGLPLSSPPSVRLQDRFGNPVARAGVVITAANADPRVTVTNQTATTSAEGVAVFDGLTLRGTIGVYSLEFRAAGLASALANSLQLGPGPAHHLGIFVPPPAAVFATQKLTPPPVVEIQDEQDNPVGTATAPITAELVTGGTLSGSRTVSATGGRATFADLVITDTGTHRLRFSAPGLGPVETPAFSVRDLADGWCSTAGAGAVTLTFELGQTLRRQGSASDAPQCLEFDLARGANQQYLILFENMPAIGTSSTGLFPGIAPTPADISVKVEVQPAAFSGTTPPLARLVQRNARPPEPVAGWDFGAGPILEGEIQDVPAAAALPKVVRNGVMYSLNAVHPVVGDTIQVFLQGIPRLSISSSNQRVVVRHISDELIFAEDTRLATMPREGGGYNTPLTAATMDSIAQLYAQVSRVQGNMLFDGVFNAATVGWGSSPKVLAVHTLMYANNIWGYTYPTGYYFAYDFWVGTNGSTRGLAQNAQRLADNLFMHEIAHMRHQGLLERAGVPISLRGNTWLVEGFARFSERLSVANRLLGTATPSRLDNVLLPYNPAFNNSYYFDDVPTYLQAGAAMFGGYSASSYVFDYFLDQVALRGQPHLPALREFLVAAGAETTLDAAVSKWLPGLTFGDLFTRARVALYADDYGVTLPASTQYLQFQLRASRPPGSQSANDPRNRWPRLKPGELAVAEEAIAPGSAAGYLVDGTTATGSAKILLTAPAQNTVISITRIR